MSKFLIFTILFSLQGYSQTSEEDLARERILNQYGNKEEYEKKTKKNIVPENQAEIQNIDTDTTESIENLENIQDIGESPIDAELLKEVQKNLPPNMKVDENFLTKFMDDKMKSTAMQMIKKNPFASMKRNELKKFFLDRTEGTQIGAQLAKSPRAMRVLVEIFHHEKAIPNLISIINKPQKMKYYGYSFITVMIIAFLINMKNSKSGMAKRIILKFSIMLTTPIINFGIFYFLFQDELASTVQAVKYAW